MGFPHGKIPVGTYCLNMMFFWAVLLCMTGVVAGRLFYYKISYYLPGTVLYADYGFTTFENQIKNDLAEEMLNILKTDK